MRQCTWQELGGAFHLERIAFRHKRDRYVSEIAIEEKIDGPATRSVEAVSG
jgi:hypothetical protein